MQAGAEFGITPYGTEALNVLRIEKGHVSGAEITGHATARDLGLAGMVTADKDCIGKVLAQRPALLDPARPIVVGVKPRRSDAIAHRRLAFHSGWRRRRSPPTMRAISPRSPSRRCSARTSASAFSPRGRERIGERIRAVDLLRGHDVECVVASPVFYDPEGTRTHG